MGAVTAAVQAPKNQKIEPAKVEKPAPKLRVFEWNKPIEQNGVWVVAPMLASGNSSLVVKGEVANNMGVSGVITKIWYLPSGCYLVIAENKTDGKKRGILVTGGGCTSELADDYDLSEFS